MPHLNMENAISISGKLQAYYRLVAVPDYAPPSKVERTLLAAATLSGF